MRHMIVIDNCDMLDHLDSSLCFHPECISIGLPNAQQEACHSDHDNVSICSNTVVLSSLERQTDIIEQLNFL